MTKQEINNLLVQIQQQDENSFNKLYEIMHKGIFAFAYSYVQSKEDAEDIMQDTFIKVKINCQSYIPKTNASAWIIQIAKNLCLDFLRKKSRVILTDNEIVGQEKFENQSKDFEMMNLLNVTLDEIDRQIVVLHVVFNYKAREISKMMNIPLGTVLWKYNKSIKLLNKKLKEEYGK